MINDKNIKVYIKNYINEMINNEVDNTRLYHTTDIENAKGILKDNMIETYEYRLKKNKLNPSDWYNDPKYGKYIYVSDFKHDSSNFYGLVDIDVTFVINRNKLKNKMYQADKNYEGGTISVLGNIPLSKVIHVLVYNYDDELIELLKNRKIKYSIIE